MSRHMMTTMTTTTVLDGESVLLASLVAVPLAVVVDFFVTSVVTGGDGDVTATGCLVVIFVVKLPSLSCVVTSGFAVVVG